MKKSSSEGAVAIVTGGASGIGRELVVQLTTAGASVLAVDMNADGLADVAEQTGCAVVASDITTIDANEDIVDAAVSAFGRVDLAFVNAGVLCRPFEVQREPYRVGDLDMARFMTARAVNLDAVVFGTVAAAKAMVDSGGGAIIATASVAALGGHAPGPMYSATKAGVVAWCQAMKDALAADGITIDAICPAGVATPLVNRTAADAEENARLLAPATVAEVMIATALDDGSGRAVSVVAGRDPVAQVHPFAPVPGFHTA